MTGRRPSDAQRSRASRFARPLAAELPGRKRRVLRGTLGSRFAFSEQPKKNVIFRNVVFRLAVA